MYAHNEMMTVDRDEAQRGQAEPATRERAPRFKLIKLEERIAPGSAPVTKVTISITTRPNQQ